MARILVLPGDGIGPEVTEQARRVLEAAARRFGLALDKLSAERIASEFGSTEYKQPTS